MLRTIRLRHRAQSGRGPARGVMGDVLRVDSSVGDLILQPPEVGGVLNASLNVSLACFTQLARGEREWDQLSQCIRYTMDLLTLQNLRVYLFPFRIWFPWETAAEADVAVPAAAAAPAATPGVSAPHVDDHHDHHHYDPYYVTGYEIIYLLFFLGLLIVICGAALGDTYVRDPVYDADGVEWRYRDGRYVRVAAGPSEARSSDR